jgi:hypothetical protein
MIIIIAIIILIRRNKKNINKKTLVIVLGETRAHELTFNSFKMNLIDVLNADLCLCIGVKKDYDYSNPFYKLAKYKFLYDEPEDYSSAFDYANEIIMKNNNYKSSHLNWREFLKIKDQFLGGIKDSHNQHPGSGGILIFYRWFLLKNLIENNLIDKYDRFIITRSDFIYQLHHPDVIRMNGDYIWIPDGEDYGGYTDRHVVLSPKTIESYLNILTNMIMNSNDYYNKMIELNRNDWNLEKMVKFNLEYNKVNHLVRFMPYIMYSVRNINGSTSWSKGIYSNTHNYYIKYMTEYDSSTEHKNKYTKDFYNNLYS